MPANLSYTGGLACTGLPLANGGEWEVAARGGHKGITYPGGSELGSGTPTSAREPV